MAIYDPVNLSEHINLNITHLAQKVLDSDRLIFGTIQGKGLSFGTLVNTIISSYDNDFPLTESLIKKKDYQSYIKMRLSKTAIDALIDYSETEYPFGGKYTVTQYIKCVIESYARTSFLEREKLVLKKTVIEPIENAIHRGKAIKINFAGNDIEISPYKIVPSKEGTFQYLIGTVNGEWKSYRLSRINFLKTKGTAILPATDMVDEILAEFGATFFGEPLIDIKIRFTAKGLLRYEYSVIHRPVHTRIESDVKSDGDIYIFHCSEKQALFFFFSYADDVEILEPLSLRQRFIDMYRRGYEQY